MSMAIMVISWIIHINLFIQKENYKIEYYFHAKQKTVYLEKYSDTQYRIVSTLENDTSYWEINYNVYRMEYKDINNDGVNEIVIGVIKKTRFDPNYRKRIFIFKHYENQIRPMWLGTRLSRPLSDFTILQAKDTTFLLALEQGKNSNLCLSKYKWNKFGFEFIEYIAKEKNSQKVKNQFYEIQNNNR
jgi:hypothetical protein